MTTCHIPDTKQCADDGECGQRYGRVGDAAGPYTWLNCRNRWRGHKGRVVARHAVVLRLAVSVAEYQLYFACKGVVSGGREKVF